MVLTWLWIDIIIYKSTYQPSEFDSRVFDSIIKSVHETIPQKGNREEIIEQGDYLIKFK